MRVQLRDLSLVLLLDLEPHVLPHLGHAVLEFLGLFEGVGGGRFEVAEVKFQALVGRALLDDLGEVVSGLGEACLEHLVVSSVAFDLFLHLLGLFVQSCGFESV